jgi:Dyp-type peroxidase family
MTSASTPRRELDRSIVQGIGLAGFRKAHQHLMFVQFGPGDAGKRLIARLAPLIANDTEVSRFNQVFSEIRRRRGTSHSAQRAIQATWIGFAISAAGYQSLGIDPTAADTGLPPGDGRDAFLAGMVARSNAIGDSGPDDPGTWVSGIAGVHAVIVVASDSSDGMDDVTAEMDDLVSECKCHVTYAETGHTLGGADGNREHFGFRDGVSQPTVADYGSSGSDPGAIALGEFVLGFPDQAESNPSVGPLFDSGSYLVFRRLVQDVDGFNSQAQAGGSAASPAITPELFAAKMVGRWPSGAPLELNPEEDPGSSGVTNQFAYLTPDDDGHVTPQWAHIRKVNPRDETQPQPAEDPARHRMIRRGIPFTRRNEKGLHFLSVVADPVRQFEFVQRRWSDDGNFPNGGTPATPGSGYSPPVSGTPGAGPDPISSHRADGSPVGYVASPGATPQPIALIRQFVHVTGGEYFFAPSIRALEQIGSS